MNHFDVLIATPGHNLEAHYVKSLVDTLAECDSRGVSYTWLNSYSSLIHNARETTLTGGDGVTLNPLDKGPLGDSVTYNKVFWIDSDIFWTPENFFRLYDSEHEVVAGAYLLADGVTTSVHAWGTPGGIPKKEILKMKEVTRIQSTGFGFVAIKSGVFERLERPWFGHYTQKVQTGPNSSIETYLGEDISWCVNAYRHGVEIYFDPSVLVGHMKKVKIKW